MVWVTMTGDGPVIANGSLEAVSPKDLKTPKAGPWWVECVYAPGCEGGSPAMALVHPPPFTGRVEGWASSTATSPEGPDGVCTKSNHFLRQALPQARALRRTSLQPLIRFLHRVGLKI